MKYSTEEQVVGEWIDGKTLYQKTFKFDNLFGQGTSIIDYTQLMELDSDIDIVVNANNLWYRYISSNEASWYYYGNSDEPTHLSLNTRIRQIKSTGVNYIDYFIKYGTTEVFTLYITLQYTKTA